MKILEWNTISVHWPAAPLLRLSLPSSTARRRRLRALPCAERTLTHPATVALSRPCRLLLHFSAAALPPLLPRLRSSFLRVPMSSYAATNPGLTRAQLIGILVAVCVVVIVVLPVALLIFWWRRIRRQAAPKEQET